jgi:N-acetylneuraminate lyase
MRSTPKGKVVIVHVGAYRTSDALELARHAARIGADAVASLPPLGSYSFAEVREYYEALAAVTDLPIFVYYFPSLCPAIQSAPQALDLLAIRNVVGLKFTDLDLNKMHLIKKTNCIVFNGYDEIFIAGLLMGADGGIGSFYNLVPELLVETFRLARENRWQDAKRVQARISDLIEIGLKFPMVPAIKMMLKWQGIDCGEALAPRRRLTEEESGRLRKLLTASSFEHLTAVASYAQ